MWYARGCEQEAQSPEKSKNSQKINIVLEKFKKNTQNLNASFTKHHNH